MRDQDEVVTENINGFTRVLKEVKDNGVTAFLVIILGLVVYVMTNGFMKHLEQNNMLIKEIGIGINTMNNLLVRIDSSVVRIDKTLDKMDETIRKQESMLMSIAHSQEFMIMELELRKKYIVGGNKK
ncbi:MAG: hypothetical protein ACRCZ9_12355 [Fusobacteriaceae bacterium]